MEDGVDEETAGEVRQQGRQVGWATEKDSAWGCLRSSGSLWGDRSSSLPGFVGRSGNPVLLDQSGH